MGIDTRTWTCSPWTDESTVQGASAYVLLRSWPTEINPLAASASSGAAAASRAVAVSVIITPLLAVLSRAAEARVT